MARLSSSATFNSGFLCSNFFWPTLTVALPFFPVSFAVGFFVDKKEGLSSNSVRILLYCVWLDEAIPLDHRMDIAGGCTLKGLSDCRIARRPL